MLSEEQIQRKLKQIDEDEAWCKEHGIDPNSLDIQYQIAVIKKRKRIKFLWRIIPIGTYDEEYVAEWRWCSEGEWIRCKGKKRFKFPDWDEWRERN